VLARARFVEATRQRRADFREILKASFTEACTKRQGTL